MSVTGICCNKELGATCLWCCDNRYCTNTDLILYNQVDMSCSEYIDRDIFRNILKNLEEYSREVVQD